MFDKIRQTLRVCLLYLWSVQVSAWVVWLLNGMNLGRCHIFPEYFWPQLEPSSGERIMKWQIQWQVINIYFKSWRKNKWQGNLQKKSIWLDARIRIGRKSVKGVLESNIFKKKMPHTHIYTNTHTHTHTHTHTYIYIYILIINLGWIYIDLYTLETYLEKKLGLY